MGKYKVASLFAGVGGICLGFRQAGAEISYANEYDAKACETYRSFHGDPDYLHEADVYGEHVPEGTKVDIVAAGFPCQAFSVAGYRKGFEDDRGVLYTQVQRIVMETEPRAVFLENVKNLMTHDSCRTYKIIKQSLEDIGYVVTEKILNTMEYGNIPQTRERIYVVAFKEDEKGKGKSSAMDAFTYPEKIKLTRGIRDVIDYSDEKDACYYYPNTHQYYDKLNEAMTNPDTVYQWRRVYVRENKSNVCPTLTANMGTGGHNVPLIRDDYGIRKLTPQECFALQGFPSDLRYPVGMANCHLYKQAGNSVSVPVVKRIAENMIKAMDEGSRS